MHSHLCGIIFYAYIFTFQRAKERGAKIVKDIWEESDEAGRVRFATVQTVSILCIMNIIISLIMQNFAVIKPINR
jgi:hypothetical protein